MLNQARMQGNLGQAFPGMPVPSALELGKDSSDTDAEAHDMEPTRLQSLQHAAYDQLTSIPATLQSVSCLDNNEDVDVDQMEEG